MKLALKSSALKAVAIGAIAVGAAAVVWYFRGGAGAVASTGYQTQPASTGRIESVVNASGTINPVVTVEVGSEISGLISELNADFNSEVKAGEVIARIDDRTIRARLRQTEADVASAHANREQQRANVTRARADLDLSRTELTRQRELFARQLVSQAAIEQTEANLTIAEAQLEVAKAQLTAAEAAVLQREAQLEQTNLDLDRTYIRSPVDGTVIDRQVDVGQTVAASLQAPTLFQIAQDLTKMQIEASIDEADIGQIREGLSARFTVDAHANRTFDGTVRQVRKAATVTSNVVTYKVIVDADNPEQLLLPGMTANVDIVLGIKDSVLRVANSALRFTPPGAEQARGAGGFGPGRMTERLDELVTQLGLDTKQREAVEEAMTEFQTAMGQVRDPFAGGPPIGGPPRDQRDQMGQLRQRMTNRLSGVLTSEQLTRFEQSFGPPGGGAGPGGPPGGGFAGGAGGGGPPGGMRPGQVWVLESGEPRPVPVLVGLSDAQYTEVRSQDLADGDAVIVRLAR
ncbi:MAG TPA: efflux RND transporter periplasmic adaptor subunit [Gammaproteobacteria bacterium]